MQYAEQGAHPLCFHKIEQLVTVSEFSGLVSCPVPVFLVNYEDYRNEQTQHSYRVYFGELVCGTDRHDTSKRVKIQTAKQAQKKNSRQKDMVVRRNLLSVVLIFN